MDAHAQFTLSKVTNVEDMFGSCVVQIWYRGRQVITVVFSANILWDTHTRYVMELTFDAIFSLELQYSANSAVSDSAYKIYIDGITRHR